MSGFAGWSQARTDHFVFVFEQGDQEAVRELLSFAEEVYNELTVFLDSAPPKVWVVVRGRVDQANGYTSASPPHIVLYLSPPSEPLVGLDAASYLRLLLVHELTHFINFQYDKGALWLGEEMFGPSLKEAEALLYGYAMMEGIATATETLFTDGGRGRNPFFELEPRALALEHSFFSLKRVSYGSSFPPYDRVWLGGYLFVTFLLDHYGPDVLKKVHSAYAASPWSGPWAAVSRVTGRDASELFAAMVRGLEEHYADAATVSEGLRLSPDGVGDYFLPVVTDAGWFLYRRTQGEAGAIVRWDPKTRKEQTLLAVSLSDSCSLTASRDGSLIVFAATEQTIDASGTILRSDLYALDPASGAVRRITRGAHLWQPRLSSDGSTLIAVQTQGDHSRLVTVDKLSGELKAVYGRAGAAVCTPVFSPDGTRIALGVRAGGRNDIVVLSLPLRPVAIGAEEGLSDVNGDAATPLLADAPGREYYPSFIDDSSVAFSSDRGTSLALYATNVGGHDPTLLCADPVGAWAGEVVDGKIVYATWRSSGFTLMQKEPVEEPAPSAQRRQQTQVRPPSAMPASSPYVDIPRFLYWAPIPIYLSSVATGGLTLAPGVVFGALSNLESTSLDGSLSFRTDWLQPGVQMEAQGMLGTTQLSYALSEGFAVAATGDSQETLQQELTFSFPLVSETMLRASTHFNVTTGVVDTLLRTSSAPFTFADGLRGLGPSGAPLGFEHHLALSGSLTFARTISGSDLDLFPRSALVLSTSALVFPPVLSDTGMGALAQGLVSYAFPSLLQHQVVKVGLKASYSTFEAPFAQVTNPRGAFDTATQSLPGRTLLSLDYQFPIALVDTPLVYSLGLVAIGGGAHLEVAADWGRDLTPLVPDRYVYAGVEVVFVVSLGEGSFPVLLGTSVRFDPHLATPFAWASDVRPYIAFSTDSFAGANLQGDAILAPSYQRTP